MDNDLISRSALRKKVNERYHDPYFDICLREAPAVDAVEVVRCKDCEWWNRPGCAIYIVDDTDKPRAEDYCSFGVRRRSDG